MKKFLIIILLFSSNSFAIETIRFVDFNNLVLSSVAGKDINKKIKKLSETELSKLNKKQETLAEKETKLIAKKNILEAEVFQKELENLKKEINDFKKNRNDKINEINKKQSIAKTQLIKEINIILTDYASKNSISIILNKQSVVAGKKELEITNEIIDDLNKKIKTIKIE